MTINSKYSYQRDRCIAQSEYQKLIDRATLRYARKELSAEEYRRIKELIQIGHKHIVERIKKAYGFE